MNWSPVYPFKLLDSSVFRNMITYSPCASESKIYMFFCKTLKNIHDIQDSPRYWCVVWTINVEFELGNEVRNKNFMEEPSCMSAARCQTSAFSYDVIGKETFFNMTRVIKLQKSNYCRKQVQSWFLSLFKYDLFPHTAAAGLQIISCRRGVRQCTPRKGLFQLPKLLNESSMKRF